MLKMYADECCRYRRRQDEFTVLTKTSFVRVEVGRAASRSRLSSSRRSLNPDKAASSGRARDPTRRPLELCDEDIA
ncbi:hypothetical protein KOW79_018640 [Hemibagrus wyckioides]|uniref:Uncharacterized protein n=1 Tax=Hemibagrus wyckioides TaxID=337641 RepID=A0A9D3SB73_9TELE|nr:hypothetical protein KOW79_018633 [Hemibagrus wyckioides]KAG7317599.1 hypothetical protein KOW79_018634 [Hemibagrus wyckioides]KAG7317601.1 hypothetical protein KOW79_018636 [Hemibagrus wyckioides]KAG7317602.1 hypothetical protein KOW79_018637 [Hemibagrus wyckioides]KAG7317603.1 hypothetical protein KOW79_018638 [Hemibagrus wyckioides]